MASSVTLTQGVAAGAFTFTGNPADADTLTIGDITYTFKTTTAAAYDVKIGADQDATLANLVAAINADGTGDGTDYHTGTVANPYFTAAADAANNEVDLTARGAGSWCNGIHLAESSTAITVAAANFAGVAGGTDGVGVLDDFIVDLLDLNQVNSEVQVELKKLTDAAD